MRKDYVLLIEPNREWKALLSAWRIPTESELYCECVWIEEMSVVSISTHEIEDYLIGLAKLRFLAYVMSYLFHADIPIESLVSHCNFDKYWQVRWLKGDIVESKHIEGDLVPEVLQLISSSSVDAPVSVRTEFLRFTNRISRGAE